MSQLLAMQMAAKDKHFHTGLYYKKLPALSINNADEFEAGVIFKYKVITNEKTLNYLSAHISITQNDMVIETYSKAEFVEKGKVKILSGKILQIKKIYTTHIEISPVATIYKHTLTLG